LRWYFGLFVISGFCGLVYEVVWVRLAMASFGVTTALVSIVLSTFMAGLGLGSWAAGILTRRVLSGDGSRSLRIYALVELLIGISSLAVPFEFRFGRLLLLHAAGVAAWQSLAYYVLAGLWVAVTLLPWCTCMGATFPLLMAVIRQTARPSSERSFSYLYLANVAGAFLGTIMSAFILIELVGFQGTLYIAGVLNAVVASLAFRLSFRVDSSFSSQKPSFASAQPSKLYGLPRNAPLFLLFTTGLISMGMEVLWIREFTPYLGNVVYTFAEILGVYLIATAKGSEDYRSCARRHNPGQSASTWTWLALGAVVPMIAGNPSLHLTGAFGDLRLPTIVPFCAIMGFLTPLLVDTWSGGDPGRAGKAYAVNIGGCIAGPLLASFGLLPWLGERKSIGVLSIPLFVIAAITIFRTHAEPAQDASRMSARNRFALVVVVAILLFVLSHDFETQFPERVVKRDYTATVIATGKNTAPRLYVNGSNMTVLNPVTKYMVHLPLAFMTRKPQNGLVICFGMGTSFRSMLSWGIPTTAVDLVPSVPSMFWYFHSDAPTLVKSPMAHIMIDDGRRFLDGSSQSYDAIVVDPPPPTNAAASSLLYSREFYRVIKGHLRSGGILQLWYLQDDAATTASVTKALVESFPYVRGFQSEAPPGVHFLASMQPIPITAPAVLAGRMPTAAAADLVEWGPNPTAQAQFASILSGEVNLEKLIDEDPGVPAISDDEPINEYDLLRSAHLSNR
jgi:predicted membrane-bound spermidine synthase